MIRTRPHGVTLVVVGISLVACIVAALAMGTWHGWLVVASTAMIMVRLLVPWWRLRDEPVSPEEAATGRLAIRVVFWLGLAIDLYVATVHGSVLAWIVFVAFVGIFMSLEWSWAHPRRKAS